MTPTKKKWEEEISDLVSATFHDGMAFMADKPLYKRHREHRKEIVDFITTLIQQERKAERKEILKRFEELFDKYHEDKKIAPPPLLSIIIELRNK